MNGTRYVVMANGKGLRWGNHLGIPKHLIEVNGETLLDRITRQVLERDPDAEVVISAKDPRYETKGARRHVPERDELEIDRFVPELITDNVCFLYGDTYYADETMDRVVHTPTSNLLFFGTEKVIVAVKSCDADSLRTYLDRLRSLCIRGELPEAKGWELYQLHAGLEFGDRSVTGSFIAVDDSTRDLGCPEDWESFVG